VTERWIGLLLKTMPTSTAEGARVLMQRVEDNVLHLGCPKKVFGEMSKHPGAKRLHCEGARVRVPITNENEIKERKQNENDTTTNEKPSDADS
jgi:hypothetical protein